MNDGILDEEYVKKRGKGTFLYRLERRGFEVSRTIDTLIKDKTKLRVLDLGCAEGALFDILNKHLSSKSFEYFGLEYSYDCLTYSLNKDLNLINGDINRLPIKDSEKFDAIILTAVLEHIFEPKGIFLSLEKILISDGIIIITMPDPFFEKIASRLGNIHESGHHNPITLKEIKRLITNTTLSVIEYKKFMISPWGFLWERPFERLIPDTVKLNQLFVLKKK